VPAVVGPVQWCANSRPQGAGVGGRPGRTPASAVWCRNGASGGAQSGVTAAAATWVCRFGEVATRTGWSPAMLFGPTPSAPPGVVGRRVRRASVCLVGPHQEKNGERTPSTVRIAVACAHRQNDTRVEWGTRRRPVKQRIETSVNGLSLLGPCTAWCCLPRPGRLPPTPPSRRRPPLHRRSRLGRRLGHNRRLPRPREHVVDAR